MTGGKLKAQEVYHQFENDPAYYENFICEMFRLLNKSEIKTKYVKFFYIDDKNFIKMYKKYDLWEVSFRFNNKEEHYADTVKKEMIKVFDEKVEVLIEKVKKKGLKFYQEV